MCIECLNIPFSTAVDPKVPEIKTGSDLQEYCIDRGGICILTFINLEPEYEESIVEFNPNMQVLESIKKKMHERKSLSPCTLRRLESHLLL